MSGVIVRCVITAAGLHLHSDLSWCITRHETQQNAIPVTWGPGAENARNEKCKEIRRLLPRNAQYKNDTVTTTMNDRTRYRNANFKPYTTTSQTQLCLKFVFTVLWAQICFKKNCCNIAVQCSCRCSVRSPPFTVADASTEFDFRRTYNAVIHSSIFYNAKTDWSSASLSMSFSKMLLFAVLGNGLGLRLCNIWSLLR